MFAVDKVDINRFAVTVSVDRIIITTLKICECFAEVCSFTDYTSVVSVVLPVVAVFEWDY